MSPSHRLLCSRACAACPTPCPEPRTSCRLGRWPGIGLGDAVAVVAKPIARMSDALLGTKLVGCTSCAERQARWNAVRLG
jgi:hypothetical protein